MSAVHYSVYRIADGEILRAGTCPAKDALRQAPPASGLAVLVGFRANDITEKIVIPTDGSEPYLCQRTSEEIAARRVVLPDPDISPLEVLTEVLRVKGIPISTQDLADAAATLRATR